MVYAFRGRLAYHKKQIDVYVDASLTGIGAIWDNHVYAASHPLPLSYSIMQLEMANMLMAFCCFCQMWKSKAINFHVDNKSVVMTLTNSKIKFPTLQALSRSTCLIAASLNINITVKHIAGS